MNQSHLMFANVVADSISDAGIRLTTIHAYYPRIIHGEVLTHRKFGRNARSSRAVPVDRMLEEVASHATVFIPWHWGKNQAGMQASEECNEPVVMYDGLPRFTREGAWLYARDKAVFTARALKAAGYHKQVVNRLLEPFSWIHTLITSTSWANFYALRDHDDAEPHFHDLAKLVRGARDESEPKLLQPGEWHLPYIDQETIDAVEDWLEPYPHETHPTINYLKKISAARCARISYKPFDGNASIEKEIQRHDDLVGSQPLHASPTEHQATPDTKSLHRTFDNDGHWVGDDMEFDNPELGGNLGPGFIQYRKTLPGEYVSDE